MDNRSDQTPRPGSGCLRAVIGGFIGTIVGIAVVLLVAAAVVLTQGPRTPPPGGMDFSIIGYGIAAAAVVTVCGIVGAIAGATSGTKQQ
jgi:hypothetical protein